MDHRGVVHEEAPAHGVACHIEPRNGIVLGVEGLAGVGVDHEAAHDHEDERGVELHGVERARLHREEARGHLAEVNVAAGVGKFVIAFDGGQGVFLGRALEADGVEEFFEAVGLGCGVLLKAGL